MNVNVNRKIILNVMHQNQIDYPMDQFEADVQKIKQAGGTHVMVLQLQKNRWFWERDLSDPYPNWGMLVLSLFKLIVPEALKPYLPEDYARKNLTMLKERIQIAQKHGLRGALTLCEPFYLPEEVFRDHPNWRGPRCEHPRRAKGTYYSPCIDNPEILDMYRDTMEQLLREVEIDYFHMLTNDSGAGICWSDGLYIGANGPATCRHRSMKDRVLGFLETLTEGAGRANKQIDIDMYSTVGVKAKDVALESIAPSLQPNMSINRMTRSGLPLTEIFDMNYEYTLAPVKGVPDVIAFAESLERASRSQAKNLYYSVFTSDFGEFFKLLETCNEQPIKGIRDRTRRLENVAVQLVGESFADELIEAWGELHKANIHFSDTKIEGLSWVSVNQRWINRPFVLFPDELTAEEKSYYRPFQFQANDEAQANDLLNAQCTTFIRGSYAVGLASGALEKMIGRIQRAIDLMSHIRIRTTDLNVGESMQLRIDRMELLQCFLRNAIHAIQFQDLIDSTDYEQAPEISPKWPIEADPRLLRFEAITRAEIDNTLRIIELVEGRVDQMLVVAPSENLEDVFMLSPDLTTQLRRKIDIMLDHQLDAKRLYVTPNK